MKALNEGSPYLPVSPPILFMYMSQQCIMGQGKLVMVLVQLTFMNQLYNSDYSLKFILDNQLENSRIA